MRAELGESMGVPVVTANAAFVRQVSNRRVAFPSVQTQIVGE